MRIELKRITVKDIANGYKDNDIHGVVAYNGNLNIRPAYQREFVYKDQQRNAVIDTLLKGYPLNIMYWVKTGPSSYEVLDGQQRTISICEFIAGNFSILDGNANPKNFQGLPNNLREQIENYELMIYICEGTESEKLDWFKIVNIAGEKLTDQELRNAVYTGKWLTDAKKWFSKTNGAAYVTGGKYMTGVANRQDYLETVLDWISDSKIEQYMATHQQDTNASAEWLYFKNVISWVETIFPNYRKEMKTPSWGLLYNRYKDIPQDPAMLEEKISKLMQDEDVTKKSGIYAYLLTGEAKHLNIRAFTDNMKREAYERQDGICPKCPPTPAKKHQLDGMEADHITPWHSGGKSIASNCQMLCKDCNRRKSGV